MRPLEEADRRVFVMWSIALCVGSLLLAPLAARSSVDLNAQQDLAAREFQLPAVAADVPPQSGLALNRDPFSADTIIAPDAVEPLVTQAAPRTSIVGASVQAGEPLGIVLPPNAGALGMSPPLVNGTSAVAAIITGDRAQALVYEGAHSRIVATGDRLDGHKITSISADGVFLDDGSIRRLVEERQ